MKKINVTIMCAGLEEYPRCVDLLESCSEISILAEIIGVDEAGARKVLGRSDILILDETALEQAGDDAVRGLHTDYATLKSLLIIDNNSNINMISAISLGFKGVISRDTMVSVLRKALPAIYSGEAWIPRGLVGSLRDELVGMEKIVHWTKQSSLSPGCNKMN